MRSISPILLCTITTVSLISGAAIAQDKPAQWIDFGTASKGERLQLDANSILRSTMPVDDRINMEGRDGTETDKIPMRKVIVFSYKIGGRDRRAYTISCNGKNLKANPSWRTATTYVDYWPQYFSVAADTPASRQMLKNVCALGVNK
jgi:hypothetical protein